MPWCVLIVCLGAAAAARAENLSIAGLNEKVEGWRTARKDPPAIVYQVEGRGARVDEHRVQYRNSKIAFHSEKELPPVIRRQANLECTGTVVRDTGTGALVFEIQSLRELPTDLETYLERRRQARKSTASAWYDLAEWARIRGEFYRDHELLARSEEAGQQGIAVERKALARENPEGLFALAEKARRYRLPATFSQELVHEGLTILWRQSRQETGPGLVKLASMIAERLPGVSEPLRHSHADLQNQYFIAPAEVYSAADAATRRTLHRLLYLDVLLRTITPDLAADGSNGFVVAERIDKVVPERHALAESFRDKALAARAREVETLSKPELLALANDYRSRNQLPQADQLVESWLTLRRRRLDAEDTEGLIQLTDDYRQLVRRHDLADLLLKEAWQNNPRASDIAERLTQAGYRLHEGVWLSEVEFNARPEGRLEQAIRAGRVEQGMTASHVRRSLGEPRSLARLATAGQVTEVWTYDQSGATKLVVRLARGRRQTELSVIDVTSATE